jgi:hypothetical protein
MGKTVTIAAVTHDLSRKRSLVTLAWDDTPEKAVSLPVTFGCSLDDIQKEAEAALRELSAETAGIKVNRPN